MDSLTPTTKHLPPAASPEQSSAIGKLIRFCLENKLVVALFMIAIMFGGWLVAPFEWEAGGITRYPVPVDAIPDIGENQQIVFTQWMGRSPQDVEDQISYPLTVALLGVPGVKTIRSYSLFGFSSIYIIFKDDVEFYWSRTRVLEKLNSLPAGTLPPDVSPALGPDATALGQIYWYTLEGRDPDGKPIGGWDLSELRTVQDWYARYWLLAADGVAEVASIGGYVQEYQVDVDPDAMRAHGVTLEHISHAVKASNIDVGARTLEMNRTEYFIRGIGFIENVSDIENSVVAVNDNIPILVKHVATVALGPATRRGALDKGGAPAAGGVVVARYGDNPLAAINNVKKKIEETREALPTKAVVDFALTSRPDVEAFALKNGFEAFEGPVLNHDAWLGWLRSVPRDEWPAWVTTSKVTVVAFYDRTGLIYETLGTLNEAIGQEILVTIIVVLIMVMHLRSSIIISGMLPLSVLLCFVGMKLFGVQANIVALSGIAIAIGTIVDMGVVICENILRHLDEAEPGESPLEIVHRAASEVGGAVLTAVATTVVSFLPVFTMLGAEGKLFKPLAYTKSFALIASILIALTVLPPAAQLLFCGKIRPGRWRSLLNIAIIAVGVVLGAMVAWWAGLALAVFGIYFMLQDRIPERFSRWAPLAASGLAVLVVAVLLTKDWEPLGLELGLLRNLIFVAVLIGGLLGFFKLFQHFYARLLAWCLVHKALFLAVPATLVLFGLTAWLGFDRTMGWLPERVRASGPVSALAHTFPGFGKEFMPPLDEGSYLFMPTTMTHASIGEAIDMLSKQDMAFEAIPEIESAVGKIGRAETPLDPAPISMVETVINYKPEFITDRKGHRVNFRYDRKKGEFQRDEFGELIPDDSGRPYRQWRDHIRTPDDIWDEIVKAAKMPGSTSAPKLQPIAARIVMLASGMRAPMGVKVKGPDLETIETVGLQIERFLKEVPSVQPAAVIADRIVGKPYLEIVPDRVALARYGVLIRQFQDVVEIAIGGRKTTTTVEGRERYPVRVRYQRELRDSIEAMEQIYVSGSGGTQIPITELAHIRYIRGPQVIKSEDTFLIGYIVFDMKAGFAEVDVVEECQAYLQSKIDSGEFTLPRGVSYTFAGNYENQVRAARTLALILPIALFVIFLLIYFQFKSVPTTLLVFSGIFVAWSGGFLMIWLYGQPWFLDFSVFGVSMRVLFQVHTINMSVAVWVGFLALFGIATDDGVIMSTYIAQIMRDRKPTSAGEVREAIIMAGERRVRPCLMTVATTLLALIPILTSTGRGSDVMLPMAIPSFGGMTVVLITIFVVPVLYCWVEEFRLARRGE
ncbi:MAG: efflux RND transporter permease subunit [Verrucomicrobia bacterium]|nr:efflux RND transporter permease subunit [Verrucomicrobiota bacterium]MDA1085713.1 efflux RND transporter permease subunit [Verrucomicrobiota bacterium]